jgi:hypothetical protein
MHFVAAFPPAHIIPQSLGKTMEFFSMTFIINVLFLDLLSHVQFSRLVTSLSLPAANMTPGCANAMMADFPCNDHVRRFRAGQYHPAEDLKQACTNSCDIALGSYQNSIESACAGQNYSDDGLLISASILPITSIPETLRYQYDRTCLMDKGRYCNVVAYEAAAVHEGSSQESAGCAHTFPSVGPADFWAKESSRPIPPSAKMHLQLTSVTIALSKSSSSKPAYHSLVDQELSPSSALWCPVARRPATRFQLHPF